MVATDPRNEILSRIVFVLAMTVVCPATGLSSRLSLRYSYVSSSAGSLLELTFSRDHSIVTMMKLLYLVVAISAFSTRTTAFVIHPLAQQQVPQCSLSLNAKAPNDDNHDLQSSSRLQGNVRTPTDQEVQIMDQMIDKLATAKPYELPAAVKQAFRVVSTPQFFLQIATRADKEPDQAAKYQALATNLASTLSAVVDTTTEQLEERAMQVERIVQAAAEPDTGEFLVPLLPERIQAMRQALEQTEESCLDEGLLMTLDSWMNKSHQDGMDGMVGILQQVLQMYAGTQIGRARTRQESSDAVTTTTDEAEELLDQLLAMDADTWDTAILAAQQVTPSQLLAAVQRATETIVLSLDAGSFAQRVQAEYLQELIKRIESIQQQQKQ